MASTDRLTLCTATHEDIRNSSHLKRPMRQHTIYRYPRDSTGQCAVYRVLCSMRIESDGDERWRRAFLSFEKVMSIVISKWNLWFDIPLDSRNISIRLRMPGIPQEIALIGSADLICEYLGKNRVYRCFVRLDRRSFNCATFPEVAISSILFQRGVYAPEEYKLQEFYGLNLFVLDSARGSYMKERLRSLKGKADSYWFISYLHFWFLFLFLFWRWDCTRSRDQSFSDSEIETYSRNAWMLDFQCWFAQRATWQWR